MKKITFSILTCLALFTACKKDDKKTTSTTFTTIADKKWQLSAQTYVYMGTSFDGYSALATCQKDNLWTMKSDKTNEIDEGDSKCNASDPQTSVMGTWELRSGDKELYVKGLTSGASVGVTELTFSILEASATTLKLQYTTTVGGPTIVNTATYTAK